MGKFGKRTVVSDKLENIMFGLLGESGVGKTSTMAKLLETYFGEDGYIILDLGKEQGMDALEGYTAETCETYEKYDEVISDIIENKKTDYPNLKVVLMDTLDQLVDIYTPHVIRLYNSLHRGEKNFKKAESLNAAWGGFGSGEDKVSQLILERFWELKKVGVGVWFCGHVKPRNKVDPESQSEYSILSADIAPRIFEAFKTKSHVIGVACIDRTIEEEGTGRKNIVTKKEITKNRVKKENRKIVFRDDSYSVDAKSRFADIVPTIPLDPDALYNALVDAIASAKTTSPKKKKSKKKVPIVHDAIEEPVPVVADESKVEPEDSLFDEGLSPVKEITAQDLKEKFSECDDADIKAEFTQFVKAHGGVRKMSPEEIAEAYAIFE